MRVEIRERVVHDSVPFEVLREVERVVVKDTVSVLANTWARSEAEVDSLGYLHHSLESIPQVVYVPYSVEVRDTTIVEKESETIVREVNRLTRWQSWWMMLGKIAAAVVGLALLGLGIRIALKFV